MPPRLVPSVNEDGTPSLSMSIQEDRKQIMPNRSFKGPSVEMQVMGLKLCVLLIFYIGG
jgi:hypothetical protein